MTKNKNINLDKIILDIVKKMQPIPAEEIWMEIGEDLDLESKLPQTEVGQRLASMVKEKILTKVKSKNGKVVYTIAGEGDD